MRLSLNYSDLSKAISNSDKLASELDDYCDSLSKKVQTKMYNVEGGMSSALNTADYYINRKISDLRTKSSNARNLSQKISGLLDTAKRVDSDVKATIEANQENLFTKHAELRPSNAQLYLTSFLCDMKEVPLLGALISSGEEIGRGIGQLKNEIRYWYKCEGGKELVGIVLSTVGAVLAVVALVVAFTFTGGTILAVIAGVAGVIGAMIGLVNSATNVVTSFQAYASAIGGHPGQARIYAGQDKLSDVLRDTNFHDKGWNRGSNIAAVSLDVTEAVCDIIGIVNSVATTVDKLHGNTLKEKLNSVKKTFKSICQPRNADGTFAAGKPTLWNGLKSITTKINGKDLILGDLNVKNISRLSKMKDPVDKLKTIGKLSSAINGIVSDFDRINEGDMTFAEFMLKRVATGLDKSMFKEENLTTKVDRNGIRTRKYEATNFSNVIKAVRIPVDDLGIGKLLTGLEPSGTLKNIIAPKSGVIGKIQSIIKSISKWSPPAIHIDDNFQTPVTEANLVPSKPCYVLPSVEFNISVKYRYPYFNFAA